jgi:ABC-2 type transport system ATP-binding protein
VLDGVDVEVHAGDVVGVIGRNGAGKTTLLEALLGFHRPRTGAVHLWGRPAHALRGEDKQRIGFVPQ